MLKKRLRATNSLNQEVTKGYLKTQAMAQQIQESIAPQTKTIINLKQHVATLYQQLGTSELKSWYHTLIEAGEFDQLGPIISQMMMSQLRNGSQLERASEESSVDEDARKVETTNTKRRKERL